MSAPWVWNNDYDDLEQVAEFLPAFLTVLADIESAGQYRYNDSFKGRIPGIAGDHEDTGIYLLQGLERKRAQQTKVDDLLAKGYVWLTELAGTCKYAHIIVVPTRRMGGEWAEYREARLVPRDGKPYAILPKGKRTHGYYVSDRSVLVATGPPTNNEEKP